MTECKAAPTTGTFCWNELLTGDVASARKFYTGLLGWEMEDHDMGEYGTYTLIKSGDTQVGGMMQMAGEQFKGVPPHWLSYIAVEDVDASAKKAEELGGKICLPPSDIPGVGRFSVIIDPTGAGFALFKGGS